MATRRERVILDLEDNFTGPVLKAAAATKVLDRSINDLSGHAVGTSKDLGKSADGTTKLGAAARKSGPEIDRLSGRLRLLSDLALTLGPTLAPLGAATIPVLTGALVGLGAAAGGISAAVLAFNGLGDGLKAIEKFNTERTAESLQEMRIEMEKLGPAGADFAHYIADLEPALRDLQNVARAGMFPGLEEGIEALASRGPQVTAIIANISNAVGDLGRDAGSSLAGDEWTRFFDYIETDAAPTLAAFGQSIGNLSLGLANMLVAFAPVTRDFTGGLERMTKAFADWSANLDSNQSFQSFVAYVRESGPQAVDFLGAIAKALAGLVEAAAPMGQALLPALTGMAKAFGAIAASPIGPGLYTAVAAFVAFKRAADLGTKAFDSFTKSSERPVSSLGRMAGLAAGVAGTALAVGAMTDHINRIDPTNLERSLTALGLGSASGEIVKVIDSIEQLNSSANSVDLGKVLSLGDTFFTSSMSKFRDNVDQVDQALAQLVESGDSLQASGLYDQIVQLAEARGVDPSKTAEQFDAYALALQNLATQSGNASALQALLVGPINDVGNAMHGAAGGAEDFAGALAKLNGYFDKKDAVLAYKDSIDTLRKSLRNGFTREDAKNLNDVGRSILQVADAIKSPEAKADFLRGARASLEDLARNAGPKGKAAIQEVLDKMRELGLAKAEPKITADDRSAKQSAEKIKSEWGYLDKLVSTPTIAAKDEATAKLRAVSNFLTSLNGRVSTATIRVNRIGPAGSSATSSSGGRSASSPGETPDSPGSGRVAGNRGSRGGNGNSKSEDFFGPIGGNSRTSASTGPATAGVLALGSVARGAATELARTSSSAKGLNRRLKEQQSLYDTAKSQRDEAIGRRDSISSSIQSGLSGDLWERGSVWGAGSNPIAAANARADRSRRLVAALNTLRQKGVTGPALLEIIGTGDVERAEMMAALPIDQLGTFSSALNTANAELAAAGLAGGNAIEGQNITEWRKTTDAQLKKLDAIEKAIKDADQNNDKAADRNGQFVAQSVNGAAGRGHRNGRGGR